MTSDNTKLIFILVWRVLLAAADSPSDYPTSQPSKPTRSIAGVVIGIVFSLFFCCILPICVVLFIIKQSQYHNRAAVYPGYPIEPYHMNQNSFTPPLMVGAVPAHAQYCLPPQAMGVSVQSQNEQPQMSAHSTPIVYHPLAAAAVVSSSGTGAAYNQEHYGH